MIQETRRKQDSVPAVPAGGQGKRSSNWLVHIGLVCAAACVLWLYDRHMVSGLIRADALDYAQLGRNLINGHGLTTYILRPLALMQGTHAAAQPDMTHGPLYPLLIALGFGLFGIKDGVVQMVSGLCFVLTVPLLVLLGQRLFNRTVGVLGAIVFLCNPAMLQYASEGSAVPLIVLLGTCLFLALDRVAVKSRAAEKDPSNQPARAALPAVGLVAGLLYLAEPFLFWLLPVLVFSIVRWHPNRRGLAALWVLLPLCLLALPAMVRFGVLTGNPLFGLRGAELWMGTRAQPGFIGYRMTPADLETGTGVWKSLLLKLFLAVNTGLEALQHMPANVILLFAIPGLFFRYGDRGVNRLRAVAVACLLAVWLGNLFLTFDATLLTVAFPALLLYALAYLTHLVQEAKLKPTASYAVATGLGIALLFPLATSLLNTRTPATLAEAQAARTLREQSQPGDIDLSDQPWIAAWYANRPSIWMPADVSRITAIRQQFPNARWLFLTSETRGLSSEWAVAYSGLMNWNQQYHQALLATQTPPAALRISGKQFPLTQALDGFEAVPPVGTDSPVAVLAAAPEVTKASVSTDETVGGAAAR